MIKITFDYTITKTHAIKWKIYSFFTIPLFGTLRLRMINNKMSISKYDEIISSLDKNYNVILN